MANVDNPNGFRYCGPGNPEIWKTLATDSQTISKGDAVIIASGQISIAASNSGLIHGFAVKDATSSTSNSTVFVEYVPALAGYQFEGQCSGTMTQAILFTDVDIEGTTGIMEVNEDATNEQVIRPIKLLEKSDNAMGANARVVFTVTRSSANGFTAAL